MIEKDTSSRREFLSKSFLGVASVGLIGFSNKVTLPNNSEQAAQEKSKKIINRTLGRTKIVLPIISMGVMNADIPELVKQSFEMGIRHFDTAAGYQNGRNEEMVGNVIKEMKNRNKVTIATKVAIRDREKKMTSDQKKAKFFETFEGCLKRLQMDHVDILYYHAISNSEETSNPGIMEAMAQLKKDKKIKFAGISTHSGQVKVLDEVVAKGFYDVVLLSINFSMADDKVLRDSIKNAADKGVGLVAMKTQAGGKHSSQTAVLKWVMRNENITTAIPGYTNFEHMKEDFSVAYNLEYTDAEKEFFKEKKVDLGMGFCRQCDLCSTTCPNGVDIPSLMRTHMYAAQYANFYQARTTLDEIPSKQGLINCTNCDECAAKCVRNVNISKRIDELRVIYT